MVVLHGLYRDAKLNYRQETPPPFNLPTKIHLKRITSNLYLNLKHDSRVVPDGYRLLPENVFSLAELFD